MKKNYILTLLFTFCLTAASFGQALLTEDFNYGETAGDLTAVSSSAWTAHSGTTGFVSYDITGLSMTDYPSSGVGGAAMILAASAEDVNRTFAAQTTGNVYGSALVSITAASTGNYFIHLKDSGNNFRAKVGAKDDSNGKVLFGIGSSSSTLVYGTTVFELNTTYLLVFSYNIGTGVSNLYVLSAVASSEPASPEATDTGSTGTEMISIAFRQTSGIPDAKIDGVRVALNWADIMNNSTASVKDNAIEGFTTYPNPITNNTFTLTSKSSSKKLVTIFNVLGKKVLSSSFSGVKSNVDVSAISSGIYILKVTEDGKTATKKLVIR